MPGAKGKRSKKEKKISNLQNLPKEDEKQASNIVQGETSQNINAGVQPTSPNEVEVHQVLNKHFPGYNFSKPLFALLYGMQESSSKNEEGSTQSKNEMVVFVPPFSSIALNYCQELIHSMLFK